MKSRKKIEAAMANWLTLAPVLGEFTAVECLDALDYELKKPQPREHIVVRLCGRLNTARRERERTLFLDRVRNRNALGPRQIIEAALK